MRLLRQIRPWIYGLTLLVALGSSVAKASPSDCRARIKQLVCLVDPPQPVTNNTRITSLPCRAGSEKYVPYFEAHFDRSPAIIQQVYCQLSKLIVATDLPGSARTEGDAVGIRKEFFDTRITFDNWYAWKDETSFGGGHSSKNGPHGWIHYSSNRNTSEATIDFLLAHEFGHVLNSDAHFDSQWFTFSWNEELEYPKREADFAGRSELCFYFCNDGFASKDTIARDFGGMLKTSFATLYASTNPYDDWADSFAFYIFNEGGLKLRASAEGKTFDISAHFNSPLLATKRLFIKNFIESISY